MILFDNTLISLDIFTKNFVCNLPKCLGRCCYEGDYGAPLSEEEVVMIGSNINEIKAFMTIDARNALDKELFWAKDPTGDYCTSCIDNKDCVFAYKENQIYRCAIEKAYEEGTISFSKPLSCHLYPIRLGRVKDMVTVNYNEWHICRPALISGKRKAVPLYVFLKDALIRRFGEAWYTELERIAEELKELGV